MRLEETLDIIWSSPVTQAGLSRTPCPGSSPDTFETSPRMEILTEVGHHGQLLCAGPRRSWPDTARVFIKTLHLRQGFYYEMWPWASPKCTNTSHVFQSSLWESRCSRQQDGQGTVVTMSSLGVFSPQESIPASVPWWLNSLLSPGSNVWCIL